MLKQAVKLIDLDGIFGAIELVKYYEMDLFEQTPSRAIVKNKLLFF